MSFSRVLRSTIDSSVTYSTSSVLQKLTESSEKEKYQTLSYNEFRTRLVQFEQNISRTKSKNIFHSFLNESNLFAAGENAQEKILCFDWQHHTGNRQILVTAKIDDTSCQIFFKEKDNIFLGIAVYNSEIIIDKYPAKSLETSAWTLGDLNQLISEFSVAFGSKRVLYTQPARQEIKTVPTFNVNDFSRLAELYQHCNVSFRLNNIILSNAFRVDNKYQFNLDWPISDSKNSFLTASFSFADKFHAPIGNVDGFSWIFTEDVLLDHFQEFRKYKMKPGQLYCSLQVTEIIFPNTKSKREEVEILKLWMTPDAQFGELCEINKSKNISGNDALKIYSFFDEVLQIQNTFFCDESKLVADNFNSDDKTAIRIPLRLILAIATGKTWYEKKLAGVSLFECKDLQTPYAGLGSISQDSASRNKALREIQQTKLRVFYQSLNEDHQAMLLQLIQNNFPQCEVPRTRSKRITPESLFNSDIQTLCTHIYNNAREHCSISPDLQLFVRLLTDGIDLRMKNGDTNLDQYSQDYWLKSRVYKLLWGSYFWVKKREQRDLLESEAIPEASPALTKG